MHLLKTYLLAATAAASIALAAPPPYLSGVFEAPTLVNKTINNIVERGSSADRPVISAMYCEHSKRTSPCATFQFTAKQCYNLPRYWNDKISSLYPVTRTDRCTVYTEESCGGAGLTVAWPGMDRLADRDMNDRISSIECFKAAPGSID